MFKIIIVGRRRQPQFIETCLEGAGVLSRPPARTQLASQEPSLLIIRSPAASHFLEPIKKFHRNMEHCSMSSLSISISQFSPFPTFPIFPTFPTSLSSRSFPSLPAFPMFPISPVFAISPCFPFSPIFTRCVCFFPQNFCIFFPIFNRPGAFYGQPGRFQIEVRF